MIICMSRKQLQLATAAACSSNSKRNRTAPATVLATAVGRMTKHLQTPLQQLKLQQERELWCSLLKSQLFQDQQRQTAQWYKAAQQPVETTAPALSNPISSLCLCSKHQQK
jgi:cytochrome c553